jgi:predicted RNA-binding Zn-ribbon protein involved in translation (DUF1610 family)
MKPCPHCGKSLPDYATKCRYCDTSLAASTVKTGPSSLEVSQCPSCGAPVDYPAAGQTLHCPYCGNTLVVPPEQRQQSAPAADFNTPAPGSLTTLVAQAVQQGQHDKAVELLRTWAYLSQKEAEDLANRIASGKYGDVGEQILQAMENSQ